MPARILRNWLVRLIAWDGFLPYMTWAAPGLIQELFPNRRGLIETVAVIFPPVACVCRFYLGRSTIHRNSCARMTRVLQVGALCVAIFTLTILDAIMILSHVMPAGALDHPGDRLIVGVIYSLYLSAMTFAMYPGIPPDVEIDDVWE